MSWFLRPTTLVILSVALVVCALGLFYWTRTTDNQAVPLRVADDDQEIVWLYAATNTAAWERVTTAVNLAAERLSADEPELQVRYDDSNAFPQHTTSTPEISIFVNGKKGRLRIRWYKLTSTLTAEKWVTALLQRRPAPLAIIGGSSSDLARDLALALEHETARLPPDRPRPLLFLTAATADEVAPEGLLNGIYPGRTFRFCFSNHHMAEVVTSFVWSQDPLRPDTDPIYLTYWDDDPYSRDLNQGFVDALRGPAARSAALSAARDWSWQTGLAALGGMPVDLAAEAIGRYRSALPESESILYSIGTFTRPNRWEAESANRFMVRKLTEFPEQRRPLLVIPATLQPARRFLRALVRCAPLEARKFVVANGDGLSFNTIYRDRHSGWSIQDFPFAVVFFCHRNPVDDRAGFQAEATASSTFARNQDTASSGTEDLLLFDDILESVLQSVYHKVHLSASPDELSQGLHRLRWRTRDERVHLDSGDEFLFDENGNRHEGTGEHVVYLLPSLQGELVLPRAAVSIWTPRNNGSGAKTWLEIRELPVEYESPSSRVAGD